MPHVINFDGPKTSAAVVTSATLNGAFGKAHDTLDGAAKRLGDKNEFKLNGEGYETRGKKFMKTVETFGKASACVGVAAGTFIAFPVDVLTGRGKQRPEGERNTFMDEGVLGNGGRYLTALAAGTSEVVGAGVGGLGALVTYPAKGAANKSSAEWFEGGAAGGAQAGGKIGAHVVGGATGIALDAVRVPSVLAKVVLGGACGLVGGTIGVMAGAVRAATDR